MRRMHVVVAIVATMALLLAPAALARADGDTTRALTLTRAEQDLLTLINQTRAKNDLQPVKISTSLTKAARAHSDQMLAKDYFSHNSYSGEAFSSRIVRFGYGRKGFTFWKVGEDIYFGTGLLGTPQGAMSGWMKSPAHKAVILTGSFREIGIGIDTGTYKGMSRARMFTIDFGRRY